MLTRNSSVIFDLLDGNMTLCNLADGDFFELNDTAAKIWLACTGDCTADQLTSTVAESFCVEDTNRLRSDLASFIDVLCDAGLLLVIPEPAHHLQPRNTCL